MEIYKKINVFLSSWCDSTEKEVIFKGEGFRFERANSPFVSRRGCLVLRGHGIPGLVVFRSKGRELYVSRPSTKLTGIVSRELPAHLLPTLKFPATYPNWVCGTVTVSVPDRFAGYDDVGKPLFIKPACVKAGEEVVYYNDFFYGEFSFNGNKFAAEKTSEGYHNLRWINPPVPEGGSYGRDGLTFCVTPYAPAVAEGTDIENRATALTRAQLDALVLPGCFSCTYGDPTTWEADVEDPEMEVVPVTITLDGVEPQRGVKHE